VPALQAAQTRLAISVAFVKKYSPAAHVGDTAVVQ
jgi:hypothetical protein